MDEFGFFLITQRVAHVYSAMCQGVEADKCPFGCVLQLLESDTQYRTSAQWTRDEAYWLKRHTEWPAPVTLANQFAPALQHSLRQTTYLASQPVRKYAVNAGQLAQFMTAALAAYLHRLTDAQDIILGFPVTAHLGTDRHIPGMMSNVLPLRLTVQPAMHLLPLMQQVAQEMRYGFRYQRYPSEVLRHKLGLMPGQPLFGPTVNVMPFDYDLSFGRHASTNHNLFNGPVEDLIIGAYLLPDRCQLKIDFNANPALYSEDELIIHQRRFVRFLKALAAEPTRPIGDIDLLDAAERHRLLVEWNATKRDYPLHLCIHQLFEAQAARTPDATALVYEDQALTYAALNTRANRLAHQLIELGVKPDTHVAICAERSPAMVIGLLAILKAGGAYVPLDPAYPAERLAYMLEDSAPVAVLVQAATQDLIGKPPIPVINLDAGAGRDYPEQNPQVPSLTPHHPAYVIYTSGSTGQPKGVEATIGGLANRLLWFVLDVLTELPVTALKTSISFVDSVTEVLGTLLAGGKLVVFDRATVKDVSLFARRLSQTGISHLVVVPSLLKYFLEKERDQLGGLRVLICSGERLAPELAQRVAAVWPSIRLLNFYGSSEVNGDVTFYEYGSAEQIPPQVVIGRPIANTQIYILDHYGQPVPLGVAGEIYIGGAGVARGYLNRPELTAERFVVDPFQGNGQKRMYKTGDLGRWLANGNIEYLGRNDYQVKIRGFRIELGEIEACLAQHPQVRDVAVLARGEGSDTQLVAYVAAEPSAQLASALCAHVAASLPEHMVPVAFVQLDALPLTPNGKLDRHALPAPDADAFAHQAYEAPQGELETTLAAVWSELLGLERIGRQDSFFALGGHSLLAVRLINRIAALGADLPLATLFASPSLAALAAAVNEQLTQQEDALPPIAPLSRRAPLPLSFAQQRLWFLTQLDGVSLTYHIPLAWRLRGALDITAWQQAFNTLFARHEALRSTFTTVDGQPSVQLIAAETRLSMPCHDLRNTPDAETQLAYISTEETHTPFDLARGPLIRARLIQLADDEYVFMLTQHHIVSDGWSLSVLLKEFSALYAAYHAGQPSPLPPLTLQYPDYAAWQRQWLSGERLQAQSEYWRTELADAPVLLTLPTDRPRPPQQSFAGAQVPIRLDARMTQALKRLSQRYGTTLFMTLLTAWSAVLSRLSGQNDLVIGTPSANRGHRQIEPLIGLFVNTLALRIDLSGEPNTAQLLERVRRTTLMAQAHQDLPFEQVVEIVQPPRRLTHTPLFQVMFDWQNNETDYWHLPDLEAEPVAPTYETVKFDLELELYEAADEIAGHLRYASALFDQETIARHVDYLQTMLTAMVTDVHRPVAYIDILTSRERTLLLETRNATTVSYPAHLCIHQLFEAQVERTPDASALVYENHVLTYAALNARANRLAHQLIELGVKPDTRVAICAERSPAIVVGLLAILKAGGAYVPLDPAYPAERLAHILADAGPTILFADAAGRQALGETAIAPLTTLDPNVLPEANVSNPHVPELTSRHLAYVIYTSGSTGTPKGVMVEHQGLVNLAQAQMACFEINAYSRVLQFASFSFDASAFEIFMALGYGASLYLPPDTARHNRNELWNELAKNAITHALLPPALLQNSEGLPSLNTPLKLILGGEASTPALLRSLLHRGATVFNAYGPTEITVCATVWHCPRNFYGEIVPIGQPLANTRIYLLDTYGQPVPLGATGEIYIGGAGVARGYLNRPEFTAERFLKDPFCSGENARMYKTGDLARYLPDGNLEFLGRKDHQVKIRGFRIEPGEIEARLTEHPLVREAAVLAQGEGDNKRLIAYIAAEPGEQLVSTLRSHVAASLPEYMVPAAFVRVDALPLTPNGKLDRRALPAPDSNAFAHQAYEAPQGELETTLAAIWSDLLGIEQISRHDSFFALGGHSLLAVQLVLLVQERFNVQIPVRILFEAPSIAKLARRIESNALGAAQTEIDFETTRLMKSDAALASNLTKRTLPGTSRSNWTQVLLTGATGFVGRYLLKELLRQTNAHIICLIKCSNEQEAKSRILSALKETGQSNLDQCRISVLCSDLAQNRLGLTETQLVGLADKLDAIIHNGAIVNHFFSYHELRQANVLATDTLVHIAATGREKSLHYISTLSVAPCKVTAPFTEDSDISMEPAPNGYVQSKWVAEQLVNAAAKQGIPCGIHRLAHITADSITGYCNTKDRVYRMIRAIATLGVAFDATEPYLQTPVNHAAQAIIKLALHQKECRQVAHIMGHQSIELDEFVSQMRNYGTDIGEKNINLQAWLKKLEYMAKITQDDNLMGLTSIADNISDVSSSKKSSVSKESIIWSSQKTNAKLAELDFSYPHLHKSYIQLIINNLLHRIS